MIIKADNPLCKLFDLKIYVDGKPYKEVCLVNTEGGFIHILHHNIKNRLVSTKDGKMKVDVITGFVEVKFFYKGIDLTDRLMKGL